MTLPELHLIVGHEAFQVVDVDRLFHEVTPALGFAKVRADPADGGRHGKLLADEL
jgi:hypothetical protein